MGLVLIAIGGNSLTRENQIGTIAEQFSNTRETSRYLVEIVKAGWDLVLTHGNGPQVGAKLRRVELAADQVYELPLGILDADTQGGIGYMIQQVLGNQLKLQGLNKTIVSLVTQVEVHPDDPDLIHPSKPIGEFYDEETAKERVASHGWVMKEDAGRGWRRLVPSPHPIRIIELEAIKQCIQAGIIPIAVGGGGIPVVEKGTILDGVNGVIDKDLASSLLAKELNTDVFVISTGVDNVSIGFNTPNQRLLHHITTSELKSHYENREFPPGSMGPKVEAVLDYLEHGGKRAIITSPKNLAAALDGNAGTQITP